MAVSGRRLLPTQGRHRPLRPVKRPHRSNHPHQQQRDASGFGHAGPALPGDQAKDGGKDGFRHDELSGQAYW